jgi:hypothetical protein
LLGYGQNTKTTKQQKEKEHTMFTENNSNILRSLVGILGAATLTVTIFYGAVGPDPNADAWTTPVASSTYSAGSTIAA